MLFNHANIIYNPLQEATKDLAKEDCNLIVLAPTSSGKTIVAEQVFNATKGRCLYLSPFKALTSEKLLTWADVKSKVAITGDHKKVRSVQEDLVLMTTESLDSKSRSMVRWLQEVKSIVCDESHLLSVDKRGDAFEIGLTRTSRLTNARIVFLSATMPNTKELAEWLTTLNGKPTEVIKTDWRPVKLNYEFIKTKNYEWDFNSDAVHICKTVTRQRPDSSVLIFVHSIAKGQMLSKALGAPFHCSRKGMKERQQIEEDFRSRKLKVLISTSTLAWGINMPCDVGVIVGAHRGPMPVDIYDLKQMAGRIGRYGLSTTGVVFFILKNGYYDWVVQGLTEIRPVRSVLDERLYFHLCSFIAREHMGYDEIKDFLEKTLAWQQEIVDEEVLNRAIEKLQMYSILSKALEPTSIARASAYMYVDPIDLWHMRKNLSAKPNGPKLIAKALAEVPSMEYEITLPDIDLKWIECKYSAQTVLTTALAHWLSGEDMPIGLGFVLGMFIKDLPRWMSALRMSGLDSAYAAELEIVVLNGVPFETAELVTLPGIGRKKAARLFAAGIKNKKDLKNQQVLAEKLLGPKTAIQAFAMLNEGKVILNF